MGWDYNRELVQNLQSPGCEKYHARFTSFHKRQSLGRLGKVLELERYSTSCAIAERRMGWDYNRELCSKSTITRVWKWSWKSCLLSQAAKSWTPWQSTGIGEVFNKLRHCWKKDGMTLQSRGCSKSTLTRVWKWSWKSCLLTLHCLACGTSIWWIQVMLSDLMHCGLWASTLPAKKQSEVQWSRHKPLKHDVCKSRSLAKADSLGHWKKLCTG